MYITEAHKIGRFDLTSEKITEYTVPSGSLPTGGITAAFGFVWYTDSTGIGRLDVGTGAVTHFDTPTPYSVPSQVTASPNSNLWFTESNGNNIGRLDPNTGAMTEFALPEGYSLPNEEARPARPVDQRLLDGPGRRRQLRG